MIVHTRIRNTVIQHLNERFPNIKTYDGRPTHFDESELPIIAVYLTEPRPDPYYLDSNQWTAILHLELFLKSSVPDATLDKWVEEKLYPAVADMTDLGEVITDMTPKGYDYDRDDEMSLWASVDLSYQIKYEM
ncbi:phage tail terminator protein [Providencia alcalifaciens]|uniref:phage tail terminator protein n=1 Tax=Providencia alcalifaciens TaxID=126385 RepID=UPI000452E8F8|nr:phage tail terminator protein [Providencia alcalifaciens]ETT08716.1 phage minor tail protein U [Providencia alcalifaciens F90-2004]MTC29171.1 phage tail protein [Providencia alcalifaciens]MTC64982.1 phage tail protein [Providencia alcalifaciens]